MNARTDIPQSALLGAMNGAEKPSALFEPFEWVPESAGDGSQSAIADVCAARDIAAGVAHLIAMLERDDIDDGCTGENGEELVPLLPIHVRGNLQRLAIRSLELLSERMDRSIDRFSSPAKGNASS